MRMAAAFLFQVFPTSGLPIYRQLVDEVRRHVASGRLRGAEINFSVGAAQYAGRIDGNRMEGTVRGGTGRTWTATRAR